MQQNNDNTSLQDNDDSFAMCQEATEAASSAQRTN
jgi:hypothetical protein